MEKQQFISMSLPFKLVCQVTDKGVKKLAILSGVYVDGQVSFFDTVESNHGFSSVKPVLYPLSDYEELGLDITDEIIIQNVIDKHEIIENVRFAVIQYLVEKHFDIYRLIEKKQAINVNTLPENPYK